MYICIFTQVTEGLLKKQHLMVQPNGEHFYKYIMKNGWDVDKVCENIDLTIIASVDERRPDAKDRLDRLEIDFENRLMTMDFQGGMNVRNDKNRRKKK